MQREVVVGAEVEEEEVVLVVVVHGGVECLFCLFILYSFYLIYTHVSFYKKHTFLPQPGCFLTLKQYFSKSVRVPL